MACWRTANDKRNKGPASYLDAQELRSQSHSFEAIANYKRNGFTLFDEHAESVQGMRVTASFLALLKVTPMLGRNFQVEEEKRGAKFWRVPFRRVARPKSILWWRSDTSRYLATDFVDEDGFSSVLISGDLWLISGEFFDLVG